MSECFPLSFHGRAVRGDVHEMVHRAGALESVEGIESRDGVRGAANVEEVFCYGVGDAEVFEDICVGELAFGGGDVGVLGGEGGEAGGRRGGKTTEVVEGRRRVPMAPVEEVLRMDSGILRVELG